MTSFEIRRCRSVKNYCTLFNSSSKDELWVAEILLNLGKLVAVSESTPKLKWACRRTRSKANAATSVSRQGVSPTENGETREPPPEKNVDNGGDANSPATPLSFSPSDSDEKSKNNRKRRAREEYMETVQGLTHRHDLVLVTEVENAGNSHKKMKIQNSQLESMEQGLLLNRCETEPETGFLRLPTTESKIGGQKLKIRRIDGRESRPSTGLGFVLGPIGIPDLLTRHLSTSWTYMIYIIQLEGEC